MRAYKNKQFLVFEFQDGKNVKYDLAAKTMIGKRGNPVKGLSSQLAGMNLESVIKSFECPKYRQFLEFVKKQTTSGHHYSYSNVGTFLSKICRFSRFEQYFAAGVTNVDPEIKCGLHEIPKDLIRLSREHDITLNDKAVAQAKLHKDKIRNIYEIEDLRTFTKPLIGNILFYELYTPAHFNSLVQNHNYHYESLIRYIDNLMTYEALGNPSDVVRELNDYANMMSALSPRYEKYPRNFLTTHKIAARNYNRLKQEFPEELFVGIRDAHKERLQCSIGEYTFMYPRSTQEIKDEAVEQQNCLASYIQRVLDNKCHIVFMRKKDRPDKSLVTLEVCDGSVAHAKGKYNRDTDSTEAEAIKKYDEKIKQRLGGKKHAA